MNRRLILSCLTLLLANTRAASAFDRENESSGNERHVEHVLEVRGRRLPARLRSRVVRAILESSADHRVDPKLVLAVIEVESSFRPRARSSAGALGLMQLLPDTGRYVARKLGLTRRLRRASALFDPDLNVRLGVLYLSRLTAFFDGDRTLALTAYCYGPFRVQRMLDRHGALPARWLGYARAVERAMQRHHSMVPTMPEPGAEPDFTQRLIGPRR